MRKSRSRSGAKAGGPVGRSPSPPRSACSLPRRLSCYLGAVQPADRTRPALASYRVLDLTSELGGLSARLLAGMGADVIRVEPPGGHPTRRRGPFLDGLASTERGLYWLQMNAAKRG